MKKIYLRRMLRTGMLLLIFFTISGTAYSQLVINEVLADPASDLPGDANGDGTRSASDDEFIEFVNSGTESIDISGWIVSDTNSTPLVRHIFPGSTIIPSGGVVVVFGGGTPIGAFGGAIVQIASSGSLGLSNTNEGIFIINAESDTVTSLTWADFNGDHSFNLNPDITGTEYVAHETLSGGTTYSPGTKTDGTPFDFDGSYLLVINEIHADPAPNDGELTPGDANGDGVRPDGAQDEFLEFVNRGLEDIDVSGWKVYDMVSSTSLRHTFPDNTIIPSGKALVLFGGGTPAGDFGGSIVQTASEGQLGLTNGGDVVFVTNVAEDTIIYFEYSGYGIQKSLTLEPDILGSVYVAHDTAVISGGKLFSPGTLADGIPFSYVPEEHFIINEILADAGATGVDPNGDGALDTSDDEFIEFVNSSLVELDISGWMVSDVYSTPTVRHIFPDNTILPAGGALVLFGGGTPTGTFGNSIVQTASSGQLALTNSGDTVVVQNAVGDTIISFKYGNIGIDMSITLDPDITGDTYVAHDTATNSGGALYSPGTKIDGSLFLIPENTTIQFLSSGTTAKEGDGTISIDLAIAAPSASAATTVDVVLTSGDAVDINNYTTQTVTFAAGSADPQTVTITITDDDTVEPNDTLVFELQNLSGGTSAELGVATSFELVLEDNDFATSTLIINEFMAWPAGQDSQAGSDPTVDSNGDGIAHFEDDEFIEFVNAGTEDVDISGWKIFDINTGNDPLRHIFPDGTVINPGGALVVFGGGNPTGEFGGSPVMLASQSNQGLGLTNDIETIVIKNKNDETVLELSYGQQKRGTSTTLNPDITGAIGPHPLLGSLNISPGTKVDGSLFEIPTRTEVSFVSPGGGVSESATGAFAIELSIVRPSDTEATMAEVVIVSTGYEGDLTYETQTVTFPVGSSENQSVTVSAIDDDEAEGDELYIFSISSVSGGLNAVKKSPGTFELAVIDDDVPLIFNELFANPSGTTGDANGDGVVDASEDEFIEVVNNSDESVDMSGWEFHDGTAIRHVFTSGTTLPPGGVIVVFGGGIPTGFGHIDFQIASTGRLDLNDSGDTLTIFGPDDVIMAKTIYGILANDGQSITRSPDITGGFVKHSTATGAGGALFSPGEFPSIVLGTSFPKSIVAVYPNPATTWLKIDGRELEGSKLIIFDLSGSRIFTLPAMSETNEINVAHFQRGLYLYELRTANGSLLERGKIMFGE